MIKVVAAFAFGVVTGATAVFVKVNRPRAARTPKLLNTPQLINNLDDDARIFAERHAMSLSAVEKLHADALDLLTSPMERNGFEDNTIYLLAAACLHDFNEMMLLAVHMYGTGAVKLLRPLYEKVVTLSYLAKTPGEIQQFIDYSDIHWNKLLEEAKRVFGPEVIPKIVSREAAEVIAANYQKNRANFMQTDCKKCGTSRPQGSWTKKGTPELAGDVNSELRSLYYKAFLSPTLHIHPTFWGIVDQLRLTADGQIGFNQDHEQESARDAMDMAHGLMLQVLNVINSYFKLGKNDVIRQRTEEWAEAWRETAPPGTPPKTPPVPIN